MNCRGPRSGLRSSEMSAPGGPYDFTRARKEMVAALGKDRIVALHRQSRWRDIAGIAGLYGLFFFNIWYIGTHSRKEFSPESALWWVLLVLPCGLWPHGEGLGAPVSHRGCSPRIWHSYLPARNMAASG